MDQDHLVDRSRLMVFSILFVLLSSCSTNDKNKHQSNESLDSLSYKKPLVKKEKKKPIAFQTVAIPEINGKTIKCTITKDCIDSYLFKNESKYEYWSCEYQELTTGSYQILDSVLILTEKRITGNIELKEELVKLTMIFNGEFFVLDKRAILGNEKWVTAYDRSKRTRAYGKECKYYLEPLAERSLKKVDKK